VDHARRFGRMLNIISTVVMRPGLAPSQLALQVGTSERTLFRDLAQLRRMGVGISYSDGYQLQETLDLAGTAKPRPVALPAVYDQQLKVLRSHLAPELAELIQQEVEARAPAALAALFADSMAKRMRG
jgi:predicted DNA-binding transcriptional regulator YafY